MDRSLDSRKRKLPGQATRALPRRVLEGFTSAILAADELGAQGYLENARAILSNRVSIYADLFQPAQEEVGERWYRGEISVSQEHAATAIVAALARRLPPTPSSDPVPRSSRLLLASIGEEQHVLGVELLREAFEDDGWTTELLVTANPSSDLPSRLRAFAPALLALSAGFLPGLGAVKSAVDAGRAAGAGVLVGGPAFNRTPGLYRELGADGHGGDARMAVVMARRLL